MTLAEWIAQPVNWFYLLFGVVTLFCAFRVVTTQNVVHGALYLVAALAGVAAQFLLLSAEFVALVLVLVYIGAVLVLFLFGIMITRAPTGMEARLDNDKKLPAAVLGVAVFLVSATVSVMSFGDAAIVQVGTPTDTASLAVGFIGRFVVPFEAVGFILLAALVGGIAVARRDLTPLEEEQRRAV